MNKGVNAVAIRQSTNWGSRIGISRVCEAKIKEFRGGDQSLPLSPLQKIVCSAIGGGLSCWNQPIEIIRVEMQSAIKHVDKKAGNLSMVETAKYIWSKNGLKGFYRGVAPRVGLGIWQTVCMVAGGDAIKQRVSEMQKKKASTGRY